MDSLSPQPRSGSRILVVAAMLSLVGLAAVVFVNERVLARHRTNATRELSHGPRLSAWAWPSLDGRFVAVERCDREDAASTLTIFDVAGGTTRALVVVENPSCGVMPWSSDGLLHVRDWKRRDEALWIDPTTMQVERRHSETDADVVAKNPLSPDGWSRPVTDDKGQAALLWIERGTVHTVERDTRRRSTSTSQRPGIVVERRMEPRGTSTFTRRDLTSGETITLAVVPRESGFDLSEDGERLMVRSEATCHVFDANDGRELASFPTDGQMKVLAPGHDLVLVSHDDEPYVHDVARGTEVRLQIEAGEIPHVQVLSADRWLVKTGPNGVHVHDAATGKRIRSL